MNGGMYIVYVKRKIFIITKIVHMNAGVSSEKEKVKKSQSQCDTLARHPLRVPGWGVTLTEELDRLRMVLAMQKALASRRGVVIAELKDEACTQWASGWLAFQHRASRAFPDLEFNIQLSDEEVEGSTSEAEVDAGVEVFSGAPDRAPLLSNSRVPPGTSSSTSPTGALPFDSSTSAS